MFVNLIHAVGSVSSMRESKWRKLLTIQLLKPTSAYKKGFHTPRKTVQGPRSKGMHVKTQLL